MHSDAKARHRIPLGWGVKDVVSAHHERFLRGFSLGSLCEYIVHFGFWLVQEARLGCTPHRSPLGYPPVSQAAGKTAVHSRLHACSLVSGVPDVRARPDACDE